MLLDSLDLMTQTLAPRLFGLLDTPLSWTMTKTATVRHLWGSASQPGGRTRILRRRSTVGAADSDRLLTSRAVAHAASIFAQVGNFRTTHGDPTIFSFNLAHENVPKRDHACAHISLLLLHSFAAFRPHPLSLRPSAECTAGLVVEAACEVVLPGSRGP